MNVRSCRTSLAAALALLALTAGAAAAAPVATSDSQYQGSTRVFPDPQGGCNQGPCSPGAQGTVPAVTFLGYQEFLDGLKFMNSTSANAKVWSRYLEVWTLDGKLGANSGDGAKTAGTDEKANFPGNSMGRWEFTPKAASHSAGIPTLGAGRAKSDIVVVRVTDESVPDSAKQRVVLSLSIHGIERAGVEGGVRALEDLVTAATSGKLDKPILATKGLKVRIPTFKDVLQHTIIYFTFPNPDGWRRGDVTDSDQNKGPGVFFQRYNGNGVDVNRDFPDIGYSFRPYSGLSEPESRAWSGAFMQIKQQGPFAAGDDLHGMLGADSFSYTLLPHGSHDYAKNERIRNAAQTINLVQQNVLSWSPLIQSNDKPVGQCASGPLGDDCAPMYGQTWGSVYDTINYTTTGALGDFMDSTIGLNADGIDNEMAYSHLDKNTAFDPLIEQMHVDGNKGLIFAHVAEVLSPRTFVYPARGRKGYVPNQRIVGTERPAPAAPAGTSPQPDIDGTATSEPKGVDSGDPYTEAIFPFTVKQDATTFNGGMRIDVTGQNVQGIDPVAAEQAAGSHGHNLVVQCKGCDQHAGVKTDDGWVTVAQDYDQSPLYLQAGLTVAVNYPQAELNGKAVEWRAVIDGGVSPEVNVHIEFSSGRATSDGATGGDKAPRQAAYDVASTDYWKKLTPYTVQGAGFEPVDADALATGAATVPDALDTLILTDQALPGYSYPLPPAVQAPPDAAFKSAKQTAPCAYQDGLPHSPSCSESFDFKIPAGMEKVAVTATPTSGGDITLTVVKVSGGTETNVDGTSDGGGSGAPEAVVISRPAAGDYRAYVDNWATAPNADWWKATVHYDGIGGGTRGPTKYTDEQYAAYVAKLRAFVENGGNLVLTDGALQALPGLFDAIKLSDVSKATSYTGQVAFTKTDTASQEPTAEGNTLADPLARNVAQPGARFNKGLRRQTFEPTPIGFAIQDAAGGDFSSAGVWQVDRTAFEAAGGRVAGTSVTASPRDATTVSTQVTLGELPLGKGVVRVLGALLPEPTEAYDHQEGLEPFAVTYTGSYLGENLTDYCAPGHSCVAPRADAPGGSVGAAGSSAKACIAARGFRSAKASQRGRRGLRFAFKRSGNAPVHVDLFQVSKGRRVLHERLIARFASRKAIAWNGRKRTRYAPTDGYYFARFKVKTPAGSSGTSGSRCVATTAAGRTSGGSSAPRPAPSCASRS